MNGSYPYRTAVAVLAVLTLVTFLVGAGIAGLSFPHQQHHEMDLECALCHPGAEESESGSDHLMPTEEVCLDCHGAEDLEVYGWKAPKIRPSGFPAFSHRAHLGLEDANCATCHGALLDPLLAGTGKGEPSHELCMSCHDGETAGDACESCHANLHAIRPLDHGADYLHTHQFTARASAGACEECHRESDLCSECHQGENVLFLTHDRNYLFTHPLDARKHQHDCASCHDIQDFCNGCHNAEGIVPADHFPQNEWANVATGGRHAREARKDISACAACHEDRFSCTSCHRDNTPGRGNDANIHPNDFDEIDYKGAWHDDEGHFCYDCHARSGDPDGFCGYCHGLRD
jgi:hypothetical protein